MDFSWRNDGPNEMSAMARKTHCSLFPGDCGTKGITVQTLPREIKTMMEKAKKDKMESDKNEETR